MDEKLKAILANIQSLIDQATQMSGGQASTETEEGPASSEVTPDDVEKIMKLLKGMKDDPEGGTEKVVEKKAFEGKETPAEEVKKSDEGTHANDSAETVIDDQGKVNDENIREVAKAIAAVMKGKVAVQKSTVQKSNDSQWKGEIAAIRAENQELKNTVGILLDGFGLKQTVEKANEQKASQVVQKATPDFNELKKSIVEELKGAPAGRVEGSNLGWGMDTLVNPNKSVFKSLVDGIKSNMTVQND